MGRTASVSVLLLRPLVGALAPQPEGLTQWLRVVELTPEILADPEARVSPKQFSDAWAELARLVADPLVALRIADECASVPFGIVEYVCRAASTLGDALRLWARYLNLLCGVIEVSAVEEADRGCTLQVIARQEAHAPLSQELCFALLLAKIRPIIPSPLGVHSVEFSHRSSGDPEVYRAWFGAPVHFGAARTQMRLASGAGALPLLTGDPALLEILRRHADDVEARDRGRPPLTTQLRRILPDALREDGDDLDRVARRLGLGARSLQRRLKQEGTSFAAVRDELRRELADRYLDDELSIAEISFLLGFSEPSAFFRAFKRWTGQTPLESRERRRLSLS
jgi:AraC-like DNA-binding protein